MPTYYLYPIYAGLIFLMLLALVPRGKIRELAIYGIVLGGLADILAIFFVTYLIRAGSYANWGPFGFRGIPFFPPIAWSSWFILYFYFMPKNIVLRCIYVLTAAGYSVVFSNILSNLGILEWYRGEILVPFLIYISWFTLATLAKLHMHDKWN